MLTLWAYLHYVERPGFTRYLVAILFFVLGLLSKPMLVTLPFVLLLLDYWPLGRFSLEQGRVYSANPNPSLGRHQGSFPLHLVLEKVPFFVLAAVSSVITFVAQRSAGAVQNLEYFSWEARIGNALVSYIVYIGKMIWPYPLAVFYPHPGMLPMWQVAGAGLLLVCGSILVVRASRKYPYLLVGWLWYLGTLVPVIGLVQVGEQAMADRYTYVPLTGLFIMIAMGVSDTLKKWRYRKIALIVSAGLVLSFFITVARPQVCRWQTSTALFEHTLVVTAKSSLIHNNLGFLLEKQGKIEEAANHYTEALRIKSNYAGAHSNLGNVLAQQGKIEEASSHYTQALRIKPNFAEAHYNLGVLLAQQGKIEEAVGHYTEALRIKPKYAGAHSNLGVLLAQQGKIEEASGHYTEALGIEPDFAEAHYNLGILLAKQGKIEEAAGHYTEALRIKPKYAEAHNNLGIALAHQGKTQEAITHYTEALRIKPNYAEAHNNLGIALDHQGKVQEAVAYFAEALRIKPHYAEAHNNLGVALARQGKTQEAITHYTEALRIKPDFAEAHFSLGLAYLMIGNRGSALEEYKILKRINLDLANGLAKKIFK
jgi:tetratricopeptide (TPR) repeat protein